MRTEEANVNHVMSVARHGFKTIHIVCDDTDVFVQVVNFNKTLNITTELRMMPTIYTPRNEANIGKLVAQ